MVDGGTVVSVIDTEVAAGDITVSVPVVPEDATGKEIGRDVVLLKVTVGGMTAVTVVGGRVRGGRLPPQRTLKSEAPNDVVSPVPRMKLNGDGLPAPSGSNILTKLGSIGITQFTHSWTSISLPAVQRQEIAVQELYNAAAGVHIAVH